jgi:hypothetical protein
MPSHLAMCQSVCPVTIRSIVQNLPTIPATLAIRLYDLYNQIPCGTVQTVRTVQSSFFACLAKQTDRHNVSIRRLLEPVQVVLVIQIL